MLDKTLGTARRLIPTKIYGFFNPAYHWLIAFLAACFYCFPSREIKVIAVTGTKGKSTTTEILNSILEEAGFKTALSNTIRHKIDSESFQNLSKMSMPGRFFMQKILRQAVKAGCQYAIIEITSQGALLYRHRFIQLDALIFTNISPEHIDAHGSFENYLDSKLSIARNMLRSKKSPRTIIVNAEDKTAELFFEIPVDKKIDYSLHNIEPYIIKKEGLEFTLNGRTVRSHLSGVFNLFNIVAALTAAKNENLTDDQIIRGIENLQSIPGRVEKIPNNRGLTIIVDYAHTPDSLVKLYELFKGSKIIGVLGGTGGGRDTWKRSEMGRLADKYCSSIILTNEDPYDENPDKIVADVAKGIINKKPTIIMDRRKAIGQALKQAVTGDVILITGKGTDPYIMGPKGSKIPWSDAEVVKEELLVITK